MKLFLGDEELCRNILTCRNDDTPLVESFRGAYVDPECPLSSTDSESTVDTRALLSAQGVSNQYIEAAKK